MLISSDQAVLEERFTPVSANVLQYELTVTDPKTWTQPWKVAFPLKRDKDYQIFEYACHEGNNSMRNILSDRAPTSGGEVAFVTRLTRRPAPAAGGRRDPGRGVDCRRSRSGRR
jgi:hypothetical protein